MFDFLTHLFDTSDFPSRWHCGLWTPGHGWLHILSDLGVWSAYVAIPCVLGYFVLRRRDVPFRPIFWLFAAFILACGTTHLMEAAIFWWPAYRLAGLIKLLTAVVSWATVLTLVPVVPRALALQSPEGLEHEVGERTAALARANKALHAEIAERRRAEAEARDMAERLRAIVDTAVDGIITIDEQGTVETMNPAAVRLFGYAAAEVLGGNVSMLMPEPYRGEHDGYLASFLRTGQAKVIGMGREVRGRRKDGSEFPLDLAVSETRLGERRLFTGIVRDVSERKQGEEALRRARDDLEARVHERTAELARANRDLERSNLELQNFAFVASHDLQEPLRKIQAFGDLLRDGRNDALGDEGRDFLDRMQAAAGRMSALIEALLDYSRLTSKARPSAPVDLGRIAREAVSDLHDLLRRTDGRVEVVALPTVVADPTQMRQLLQNLIGNALKFHRPGVPPVVEVHGDTPPAGAGPPLCRLTVRDNGIGFDPKYRERIFEVFQRLHGRGEYEGTGIGLAVCKKIAERHGGTITATSTPGQGATFVVTLPRHRTGTEEAP